MSLYFSYMGNRIPEHLRATRAVMNLSGHAATCFGALVSTQAPSPGNNSPMNYVKPSVLLISISGHVTGWNNAPRRQALRPVPRPSANDCWSAMTLVIKKPYEDTFPDSNRIHVIGTDTHGRKTIITAEGCSSSRAA